MAAGINPTDRLGLDFWQFVPSVLTKSMVSRGSAQCAGKGFFGRRSPSPAASLYAGLQLAVRFEHTNGLVFASIAVAMALVFTTRTLAVAHGAAAEPDRSGLISRAE